MDCPLFAGQGYGTAFTIWDSCSTFGRSLFWLSLMGESKPGPRKRRTEPGKSGCITIQHSALYCKSHRQKKAFFRPSQILRI